MTRAPVADHRGPALQHRVLVELVLGRTARRRPRASPSPPVSSDQPQQLQLVEALLAHALQALAGVEHRLVLGLQGDDVVALGPVELDHALEARLSDSVAPRGEDDLLVRRADQRGHLRARLLDRRLGLPAEGVVARRGVAEVLPQVGQHRLQHARIERGRGVVVHVDRELHRVVLGLVPTSAYQCGPDRSIITTGVLTARRKPTAPVGVSSLGLRSESLVTTTARTAPTRVAWGVFGLAAVAAVGLALIPAALPTGPSANLDAAGALGAGRFGAGAVLVFLGGLLTALTPCVYPLIPITVGVFGARPGVGRGKAVLLTSSYVRRHGRGVRRARRGRGADRCSVRGCSWDIRRWRSGWRCSS